MNEAETRAEHIDPALKAAGWGAEPNQWRTTGSSNSPGSASSAQTMKNCGQPSASAMKPLGADNSDRGKVASVDSSANCVAVNSRFVSAAMNASKAALPIPTVRFSKPITVMSQTRS